MPPHAVPHVHKQFLAAPLNEGWTRLFVLKKTDDNAVYTRATALPLAGWI